MWYLAWVRLAVRLEPLGTGSFEDSQQVYFQPRKRCWMVFDGTATYAVLRTETAIAALKSCRDEHGKVGIADDQEALRQRFMEAMAAQGGGFAYHPRG